MIEKIKTVLDRPFSKELIKYKPGSNNRKLAYVETVHYVDRLNEAFEHYWSWEVMDYHIEEKQVYCKGKLTINIDNDTIIKEGFGGKMRSGEIGDDLKGAASDALKKAASLLGIGLHLYKGK